MSVVIRYSYRFYEYNYSFLFMGVFGILAFILGLIGGIMALRKQNFALSIIGMCFLVIQSFVTIGAFFSPNGDWTSGVIFGIPLLVLSISSLSFLAISQKEFYQ